MVIPPPKSALDTPEGMAKARAELEAFKQSKQSSPEDTDDVLTILSDLNKRTRKISFTNGMSRVDIRIKSHIPKSVQLEILRIRKETANQEEDEDDSEEDSLFKSNVPMYYILSGLCLDEPWTDWKQWALLDEGTADLDGGVVPKVFEEIVTEISKLPEKIKKFR